MKAVKTLERNITKWNATFNYALRDEDVEKAVRCVRSIQRDTKALKISTLKAEYNAYERKLDTPWEKQALAKMAEIELQLWILENPYVIIPEDYVPEN